VCALALVLGGAPVLAQPGPGPEGPPPFGGPPGPGGPPGGGIERVLERNAERLHLDAATRDKIRALAEAGRDRGEAQQEVLHRLHDDLHALLSADAPETAAVMRKADEIGRAETDLHKERLRTMLAIRALLTSEQRRELVRIHEEMRARGEWGGHGPREGGPGGWRGHGERE
jgi:Spy/CpxP family protein refolding chaperone